MIDSPIVLAAGGTGGHIFPAESLAAALVAKGHKVVFITDKQGRKFSNLPKSVQVMSIPIPRRKNTFMGMLKFGVGLMRAMYHVYRGFKRMSPSVVVGFGGYPSFPACSVAQALGIPTVLHEQNAVLGQVNRWLGKRASTLALSFEHTLGVEPQMNSQLVGTPVREEFQAYRDIEYTTPNPKGDFYVLVTGGSQGANIFSKIVPRTLALLENSERKRVSIVHQCPAKDIAVLDAEYKRIGVNARVVDFIGNMAEELSRAHLVIARSGASTLAEIALVGRPSILIPFPYAKDDHQWSNAQNLVSRGAAVCMLQSKFSEHTLVKQLLTLLSDQDTLKRMANAAKTSAQTDALNHLVALVESHIKKGK